MAGDRREVVPHRVVIHLSGVRSSTFAEQLEEAGLIEAEDARALEFEEGNLDRVDIDGVDLARSCEQVVEGIATRAGDHHDAIGRAEIQGHAIERGIFPAGVVDQIVAMDRREDSATEFLSRREARHSGVSFAVRECRISHR